MIDVRFLGTGTIGSVRPKNKLSKEYRRFSTLLINERILIDPSEDIFELEESFMLSGIFKEARDVLITHSHLDHLSVSALERLGAKRAINVYATSAVGEIIRGASGVVFHEIAQFMRLSVGGFEVIPLPANHITDEPGEIPLNYLIRGEKNIFYGLDGAFINPSAFAILKEIKLDLCILDCALADGGYSSASVNHNNLDAVKAIREIFLAAGCANDSTKFVISHIPTAKKRSIHEELTLAIGELPIRIAYDGYYIGI